MKTFICQICVVLLLLGCKRTAIQSVLPDNHLSFVLKTPTDGNVKISSNSVERFRFYNTQHPVDDPSGRSLVMYVEYDHVVSETGKAADFSLMFRLHEADRALFSPAANGNFDIYTNPRDLLDRFLAPQAGDDQRKFELSVEYDQNHLVGWVDASAVRVTEAAWQETDNGDLQIQVAGNFALPLGRWYAVPGQAPFFAEEGHFRFTIPLSEIY